MSTLKVANIESQSGGGVSAKISDVGGGQLSNRNLIINGDMRIAQRGTSESSLTDSPKFVVDRFAYRRAGAWGTNSFTMTQESSGAPAGFKHFLRLAQSGTAAAPPTDTWCGFGHYIEGQNLVQVGLGTSDAQPLTLSFYAKASQAGTYCVQLGTTNQTFIAEYSVTTSWQRFTISIPARTTGTWNTDNNIGLLMHWVISADSSGSPSGSAGWSATNARYTTNQTEAFASNGGSTFDLCGVQLEVGNTATTFEHRSFGDELRKCQRYFLKSGDIGTSNEWFPGVATNAGYGRGSALALDGLNDRAFIIETFPTTMRAPGAAKFYPGRSGVTNDINNITIYNGDTKVTTTAKPIPSTRGFTGYFSGTSTDSPAYTMQYTVDAEL